MAKYLAKRLMYIIPTFIALTFLVYTVLSLAPGDPAISILGAEATEEQLEAKREELGLNENLIVRYGKYMLNMVQGDLGKSWITNNTISNEFAVRLPNTLQLMLYALTLTIILGVPLGVISAIRQNSLTDKTIMVFSMLLISLPPFFLALIAQIVFCLVLRWLPVTGASSFKHFILPSVILSLSRIASQVRMSRSSMLDVISQDYVRTAYAKGAKEFRVITYHALRNGMLPIITSIGNGVGAIVSGAVTVETIFAIPGVGSMLVTAVRTKDIPCVMGPIIMIALIVCVVNLIVDLLYAFVDPRVQLQYTKGR